MAEAKKEISVITDTPVAGAPTPVTPAMAMGMMQAQMFNDFVAVSQLVAAAAPLTVGQRTALLAAEGQLAQGFAALAHSQVEQAQLAEVQKAKTEAEKRRNLPVPGQYA